MVVLNCPSALNYHGIIFMQSHCIVNTCFYPSYVRFLFAYDKQSISKVKLLSLRLCAIRTKIISII